MKILITGANGFIGKNLIWNLRSAGYEDILECTRNTSPEELHQKAEQCDFVYHLAGVNRPQSVDEFETGNADFTAMLCGLLSKRSKGGVPIVFTSSSQAALNNPYGNSKRNAEEVIFSYGRSSNVPVYIYRLTNVFGKWSRPNYNSAVATFCHNIARGLPITVTNPDLEMQLIYIDDLVNEFMKLLKIPDSPSGHAVFPQKLIYCRTLGSIAQEIRGFHECRKDLGLPNLADPFVSRLYSTYLSFLPQEEFSYPLNTHEDARGSFTEFLRTVDRGQVSVNVTLPGITKGQHWHNSKNEKYLVVHGKAVIRFRKVYSDEVIEYPVSANRLEVVEIPTGYTHSIENVGDDELVTLMWANEPFDPLHPDTFHDEV